ncbi:prepilin-type N-terminal cleavage/methylation domain-containing protein [Isoptericola sp. b441]|uniref:Prepilin-type N-terminal cleavage/methylation domain-containing protein n=1 Tax=Actinotalea lenta TaxID=3064654 RepID=A0ABT9DBA4_9CELL|nr:prepilin-type N-terminal cleavage/methylation domain-containing protein [Isoptericola sp. b441]MDO8107796.1 prepilin-type N-terminal cleavage/methylation domain-containing protein [Isoptericola sp. b441]
MIARIRKSVAEKDKGFTLIELLVVIIIIGILAAIAIPVFLNQRKKGWDAQAKSDLKNMATAEETWLTDNNAYTNNVADLQSVGFNESADNSGWAATALGTTGADGYCMSVTSKSTTVWYYDSTAGVPTTTKPTTCP